MDVGVTKGHVAGIWGKSGLADMSNIVVNPWCF